MTTQTTAPAPPQATVKPRRRRVAMIVGLVLLLGGAGLLGYVAWQYWGTNIVSKQKQAEIRDDLLRSWRTDTDTGSGDADGSVGSTGTAAGVHGGLGGATALVRIPRFGEDYAVPLIEGVRPDDLSLGLGHYPRSADPGEIGNFAMAGHRVTHGEPFRDLPEMEIGDEVIIETRNKLFTYVLDTNPNDLIVQPDDTWVVNPVPGEPLGTKPTEAMITLTTCAELFHTSDRMVAFGHLVDTERKRR